ncbi:hypothetical protein [Haloferula sp.]|uniref:hypothetical protein n=1 Tax=Haloferula sp. TaxID=2497595 RepID=UPI00329AE898
MNTPSPHPPQVQAAPRKGLHPMAWVGIGCGGLLIVGIIAGAFLLGAVKKKYDQTMKDFNENPEKTIAEQVVKLNPDLEKLHADDEAGEMTVRNTETGEETTITYKDLAEGKLTMKGEDGSIVQVGSGDLSLVPAWVPVYPNMENAALPFHQDKKGEVHGLLSFSTSDEPEDIVEFYESGMGGSTQSSSSLNVNDNAKISKTFKDGKKQLSMTVQRASGQATQVQVEYRERP